MLRGALGVCFIPGTLSGGWPSAGGRGGDRTEPAGGENTLVVTKDDEGKAAYLLETTGEVMEGRDSEAIIEGGRAHDHVGLGGTDELRYTGVISNFVMKGDATVIHNDREVDPDSLGWADEGEAPCDELTNTLTIESSGRDAGNYAVTVSGGIGYDYGSEAAIRGSSAVDWVGETGGIDRLRYSGRVRSFLLKGYADVYRNGERVDPDDL